MKRSILYALVCLICIPSFVSAMSDPALCSLKQCKPPKKGKKQTCQCYCAAKGGPRDWVPGDTGYVPSDDEVTDEKPKICYCRKWDFDHAPVADDAEAERHLAEVNGSKKAGNKKQKVKKVKSY